MCIDVLCMDTHVYALCMRYSMCICGYVCTVYVYTCVCVWCVCVCVEKMFVG